MSDAPDTALDEAFAKGDYHRVAAAGRGDRWQTFAALGLCGNCGPALDGLGRFDVPEARFYEGVTQWIDGDEDAAARRLEDCEGEHAARLLALIRKRRIHILSQLPWSQFGEGPHTVLDAARSSTKFTTRNIGFNPGDLQNGVHADVHAYYDRSNPPDFYLAQMVEWQLIPPNLQELPCPTLGHTADFDLHIHVVRPWLQLFDQLIVTDTTEHRDVARLADTPVATFPKTFCLPRSLPPPPPPGGRDIDVLLTGTTFHPFHREKAEILHQILRVPGIEPFVINGYLDWWQYHTVQARTRMSVSHIRHPGASPARGVETLGMGAVLLAQPETTLRLWVGEEEGLVPYDLANDGLTKTVEKVLREYPKYETAARRGMTVIRAEFEPSRLGAQYLRFATFLAARPPQERRIAPRPRQKRLVAWQGWLQEDGSVYSKTYQQALTVLREAPPEQQTVETLNDPAREILLDYVQQNLKSRSPRHNELLKATLEIYRLTLRMQPRSLALRFNFIRAALHFSDEADIEQALGVARETVQADPADLALDPSDDVMTWDYCAEFFNYRSYFDLATEAFMTGTDKTAALKALILASLHHYLGRMTGDATHFDAAASLDPDFPAYRLAKAKALVRAGDAAAAPLLRDLCAHSLHAAEAWSLLKALHHEQGVALPEETAAAIERLETRTLLENEYKAIRDGPYFRAQRLGLARNDGYDLLKTHRRPVRLSILLADMNGSRYPRLIDALQRQSLPRTAFEIVVADAFDRIAPKVLKHADTVLALGQNEYLYNRNAAFNMALSRAQGSVVALFDADTELETNALETLLTLFEARGDDNFMVVNSEGEVPDRCALHFLALPRAQALTFGGLDESFHRAAGLGGPYELAQRLQTGHPEIATLPGVGACGRPRSGDMEPLLHDLYAYGLSSARRLPKRECPAIRALREAP